MSIKHQLEEIKNEGYTSGGAGRDSILEFTVPIMGSECACGVSFKHYHPVSGDLKNPIPIDVELKEVHKTHKWFCDYLDLNEEQSAMLLHELEGLRVSTIKECVEVAKDVQEESWRFGAKFIAISECVLRLHKLAQPS